MEMGASFSSSLLWTLVDFPSTDQGCKITHIADDIWLEIFLYLPLTSIFRFKCVSKVWFSLLSKSYFINKWIKHHNSIKSFPWALFYEIRSLITHVDGRVTTITIPTTSHGVNSEVMSTHNGLSLKFLMPELCELEDQLHVVGSSNSLVLLAPTSLTNQTRYVVCNPLTQRWVSLPPPPQSVGSCATVSNLFCECFPSTCYKVVRIPKFVTNIRMFSMYIFSFDKNDWTICEVSCSENVIWMLGQYNEIVSHNGDLLWIERKNRIVAYNLNRNECRLIDLPAEQVMGGYSDHNECLNVSEGLICYARVWYNTTSFSLSAWVLKESWQLLQEDIQLHDFFAKVMKSRRFSGALCFDPLDKNVVMIGTGNYIWAYNTQTSKMEKLWERHSAFPCESDAYDMIAQPIALKLWPTLLPTPALMDNHIV